MKNWTTQLPTKDGYYWWRKNRYKAETMYCVFTVDGITYCRRSASHLEDKLPVEAVVGEWSGQLIPPQGE